MYISFSQLPWKVSIVENKGPEDVRPWPRSHAAQIPSQDSDSCSLSPLCDLLSILPGATPLMQHSQCLVRVTCYRPSLGLWLQEHLGPVSLTQPWRQRPWAHRPVTGKGGTLGPADSSRPPRNQKG